MTGLQSGSPARQLAPQSYKNSSQNTELQETLQSTSIQQSQSEALKSLPTTTQLQVKGQPQATILGVTNTMQTREVERSNAPILLSASVALVSLLLMTYFFNKYKRLEPTVDDDA